MRSFDKLYLQGEWVTPRGPGRIDVISASTEEVMGLIPEVDELVTTTYKLDQLGAAFADMQSGVNARGVVLF